MTGEQLVSWLGFLSPLWERIKVRGKKKENE
jgi:hypothetical protein